MRKFTNRLWQACGIIFQDLRNRLPGSAESFFRSPGNCLSGACGFILWGSSEPSFGRPQEIVFGSPQITVQSFQTFRGNPSLEHFTGTYGGSVDTQQCFRAYPAMFPRIICDDSTDGSWKTYVANPQNSITNL